MSQFVMSRREFAGVLVSMATTTIPLAESNSPRHVVAAGWISRRGGQIMVSDRLADLVAVPVAVGGGGHV